MRAAAFDERLSHYHERAIFAAAKLGKLSELRRAVPSVVTDISDGLDYYWDAYHLSEIHFTRTVAGKMLDPSTEEHLIPLLYHHGQ